MKKIVSVILALIISLSSFAAVAGAIDKNVEITGYPVIMVAGYSSSSICLRNEDGTAGKQIWGLDFNNIITMVLENIVKIGVGFGEAIFDKPELLADIVGNGLIECCGELACNDDGTSKYDTVLKYPTAELSNSQVMYDKFGNYDDQFETDIMGLVREYVDREDTYNFNCDFRMGAVKCAKELDAYIQDVKKISKCDKVNILAVSHGGQVTGTYLSLYGWKRDVNNAVMTIPALGGAGILYDILPQTVKFDELNLVKFIENGLHLEHDFHWLVEAQQLGFLDAVLNCLIPYLMEVTGNWGSIWDFCPTDIYEDMKAKWLDEKANAQLIADSDYMHYQIMPNYSKVFKKCNEDYGMHVSIIAGTDSNMTSGALVNGDGIIHTFAATGATVAPYGERFSDGYTQVNSCGGRYKVSPAMTVDASTAYLPDNTWFVEGLFHGMTYWDLYTRELMMLLTLTDEIKDVYSKAEYPQFHTSSNPCYSVWGAFDSSCEGFVSSKDSKIIVKNLTWENYPVSITSITSDGADLKFDINLKNKFIKPGTSVEIPFTGTIPEVSLQKMTLTFTFTVIGSLTPVGQRTMNFTIMNGKAPEYDPDAHIGAEPNTPFDKSPFGFTGDYLKSIGAYNMVSMIYTIIYETFKKITSVF